MSRAHHIDDHFSISGHSYRLRRYPQRHKRELRAWDTADLYLLNTLTSMYPDLERVGIVHDHFGALTLPLAQLNPLCYGDSWMSRRALRLNREANHVEGVTTFEESLAQLTHAHPPPPCVIGRVPKSTSQLAYLLQHLHHWLEADTPLLLAGMDKHLSRGQYELLARYFGPSAFLPGVKKARVWTARRDHRLSASSPQERGTVINIPEHQLKLTAQPNVFSREKLDIGSRLFLDNLHRLPEKTRVADVACGYGVLGLAYLRRYPLTEMILCDESFQAVESTRENLARNLPHAQAVVYADDGLKQVEPSSLELVLCNPPFHQQHTVSVDIARSLFGDAHRALVEGGELWVVANRHLKYHVTLKGIFGHCAVEASDRKFVILRSIKRAR